MPWVVDNSKSGIVLIGGEKYTLKMGIAVILSGFTIYLWQKLNG